MKKYPNKYPNKCPECGSGAIKRRVLIHKSGTSVTVRKNLFSGISIGLSGRSRPRVFVGSSGGTGSRTSLLAAEAAPASLRPSLKIIFFFTLLCIATPWALVGAVWGIILFVFALIDRHNYQKEWWCPKCGSIFVVKKVYTDEPSNNLSEDQKGIPLQKPRKISVKKTIPSPNFEEIEKGLPKYCKIQEIFWNVDVSNNREFQRNFNGFYRIRNNSEWQTHFYELMEQSKTEEIDFEKALQSMWERTGRVEASFCSKLVATRHDNQPIIDRHVLENLGLSLPSTYETERLSKVVDVYQELVQKYDSMLQDPNLRLQIDQFREKFPWAKISNVKILDFLLWQTR